MDEKTTKKKALIKKLTNTRTLISVVSLVVLVLTTWGIDIPGSKVEVTIQSLCTIGVLLGVLNNDGMETTHWDK